jgi:hypothetical protein
MLAPPFISHHLFNDTALLLGSSVHSFFYVHPLLSIFLFSEIIRQRRRAGDRAFVLSAVFSFLPRPILFHRMLNTAGVISPGAASPSLFSLYGTRWVLYLIGSSSGSCARPNP